MRNWYNESGLNFIQYLTIFFRGNERNAKTFSSKTSSTSDLNFELDFKIPNSNFTYSVKIGIRILGHIVVDNDVYSFDINTSSKNVSSYNDTSLEVLKLLISLNSTFQISFRRISKSNYLSSCFKFLWIAIEGKLQSWSNLLSSTHLLIVRTKITTWLNSRASSKSTNLRFFSFSWSWTKYCFNPCKVNLEPSLM